MFETALNPVFEPLLKIGSFFTILVISLIITIISTVIYKYTTDQKAMKKAKEEMKKLQSKAKEAKNNPKKLTEIQSQMMEKNMIFMKNSFKPMIYTFLPLIIIFGWLNFSLTYEPLMPNVPFNLTVEFQKGVSGEALLIVNPEIDMLSSETQAISETGTATWVLKGKENSYLATIKKDSLAYEKEIIVSTQGYSSPQKAFKNEAVKMISTSNKRLHPLGSFNILGWHPGWLGIYIIFSIVFSTAFRKLLKIV